MLKIKYPKIRVKFVYIWQKLGNNSIIKELQQELIEIVFDKIKQNQRI